MSKVVLTNADKDLVDDYLLDLEEVIFDYGPHAVKAKSHYFLKTYVATRQWIDDESIISLSKGVWVAAFKRIFRTIEGIEYHTFIPFILERDAMFAKALLVTVKNNNQSVYVPVQITDLVKLRSVLRDGLSVDSTMSEQAPKSKNERSSPVSHKDTGKKKKKKKGTGGVTTWSDDPWEEELTTASDEWQNIYYRRSVYPGTPDFEKLREAVDLHLTPELISAVWTELGFPRGSKTGLPFPYQSLLPRERGDLWNFLLDATDVGGIPLPETICYILMNIPRPLEESSA